VTGGDSLDGGTIGDNGRVVAVVDVAVVDVAVKVVEDISGVRWVGPGVDSTKSIAAESETSLRLSLAIGSRLPEQAPINSSNIVSAPNTVSRDVGHVGGRGRWVGILVLDITSIISFNA